MKSNFALLLVDIQKGFNNTAYWGERNNPEAEKNIAILLNLFRESAWPIFHIQHLSTSPQSPLRPGQAGVEFMDFVQPMYGEYIIQKDVNSAFIGTQLEIMLLKNEINALIFVGISTDHCVSTSVRMASNIGFETFVVADATIAYERRGFDGKHYSADDVHAIALASLHNEFATVMNTEDLIDVITEYNMSECENLALITPN